MVAGPPSAVVDVPDVVIDLAGTDPIRPLWQNELGGLTYELGDRVAKWQSAECPIDLAAEGKRLRWLAPHTPVPRVLGYGCGPGGRWMITERLAGSSAVSDRWTADPGPAVDAIADGLRRFHDQVPVDGCPFDWSVEARVADARHRGVSRLHLEELGPPPPVERLVVCHGDACAPNTIVDDDGSFVGHVDVGGCGVADRWADLAVASWSLEWNHGPGWDGRFFAAYGIAPDPDRIAYYRRLWAT